MLGVKIQAYVVDKFIFLTAAKDHAATAPDVGRKAGAMDRKTQGKRTQERPCQPRILASFVNFDIRMQRNTKGGVDEREVKGLASSVHCKTLDSNSEVAAEEILEVGATAPGMIGAEIFIESPIGVRENISSPQVQIPFVIRIPFRAGRHDVRRFFRGRRERTSQSRRAKCEQDAKAK